jgi:hypothetical protein
MSLHMLTSESVQRDSLTLKSWSESSEMLMCVSPASTSLGSIRGSVSPFVVIATVLSPGIALSRAVE